MVRVITLLAIVAVLVIAAIAWWVLTHRQKVARRNVVRLGHLRGVVQRAGKLLDAYTPTDPVGAELEKQAREIFVDYYAVMGIADNDRRRLQGAETAHARLSRLIAQHPQSLFAPADDASKEFVREMFGILHPAENKEIPHVP